MAVSHVGERPGEVQEESGRAVRWRVASRPASWMKGISMLVLSRKPGERLVIGEGAGRVVLQVNRIGGNRVTLGITAHPSIKIVRGELRPDERPRDEEPLP
jgi:carbon storage regulator CsrA